MHSGMTSAFLPSSKNGLDGGEVERHHTQGFRFINVGCPSTMAMTFQELAGAWERNDIRRMCSRSVAFHPMK